MLLMIAVVADNRSLIGGSKGHDLLFQRSALKGKYFNNGLKIHHFYLAIGQVSVNFFF